MKHIILNEPKMLLTIRESPKLKWKNIMHGMVSHIIVITNKQSLSLNMAIFRRFPTKMDFYANNPIKLDNFYKLWTTR